MTVSERCQQIACLLAAGEAPASTESSTNLASSIRLRNSYCMSPDCRAMIAANIANGTLSYRIWSGYRRALS